MKQAVLKAFFGFDLREAIRVKACTKNVPAEQLCYQEEARKAFHALVKCASDYCGYAEDGENWYETVDMYRAYIPDNGDVIWLELVPVVGEF